MKLLLTMVLCLASLLNGTSSKPITPESAVTYTIDELTLSDGSESETLPFETRATIAIGTELSELHLEAEDSEGTIAPLTLQLAPDGLRFALGDHESAYLISDADATELLNLCLPDSADRFDFETLRQFLPPLCALAKACLQDTTLTMRAVKCAADALCEGRASVEDSVRFEGGNMPAERCDALLDPQSLLKVLAALRESDIPEFQPLLNVVIPMYSLAQLPTLTQKAEADFSLPLSIYHHADVGEGLNYTRIESADAEDPFTDRVLECEVAEYEDFSDLSLSCVEPQNDGDLIEYRLSIMHSADGDSITASKQSGNTGIMSFMMESSRAGNQRTCTCVLSQQLPDNDLVDSDYNPIPDYSCKLEYSISEDEAVNIHLETCYYTMVTNSLDLRAIPSQADFQSGMDGLREVPVSASDFSDEVFESGSSALSADMKALELFLKQHCSDAGMDVLDLVLGLPLEVFDLVF